MVAIESQVKESVCPECNDILILIDDDFSVCSNPDCLSHDDN